MRTGWALGRGGILLALVLHLTTGLPLLRGRVAATCVMRRTPGCRLRMTGQPLYDSFESDPGLRVRLDEEMNKVGSLSTRNIKMELKELGLPTADVFDRKDLIRRLAIRRIKDVLASESSLPQRQLLAASLIDEIRRVGKLSDEDVLRELQKKHIDVIQMTNRAEMNRKLALVTLGLGPVTTAPSTTAEPPFHQAEAPSLFEEMKSAAGETANLVKGSIQEPLQAAGKAFSDTVGAARNFSGQVAYTRAELVAKGLLEGNPLPAAEDLLVEGGEAPILDHDASVRRALADVIALESFDDVYYFALSKSRAVVADMLRLKNVPVPKYAPLSTLAGFFADAVLAEKRKAMEWLEGDQLVPDQSAPSTPSSKAATPPLRTPHRRPTPSPSTRSFDAYEPERILLVKLLNFLTEKIPKAVGSVINIENLYFSMRSVASVMFNSAFSYSVVSVLSLLAGAGSEIASRLGRWAGGKLLSAHQVLFVASIYCIIMRRGILSFLGVLGVIRLFRVLIIEPQSAPVRGDEMRTQLDG